MVVVMVMVVEVDGFFSTALLFAHLVLILGRNESLANFLRGRKVLLWLWLLIESLFRLLSMCSAVCRLADKLVLNFSQTHLGRDFGREQHSAGLVCKINCFSLLLLN